MPQNANFVKGYEVKHVNLCVWGVGVMGCLVAGGETIAGGFGPSYGTVEFRWRERSTPGYNGSYTLVSGAIAGVDAFPTPDPSETAVLTQDATVVLVLEARVTNTPGAPGTPGRGLLHAEFDVKTNQLLGGAFARQNGTDPIGGPNPRANAKISALNLGFDPTSLVNHPLGTPRGIPAPFRSLADNFGPGTNAADIGVVSPTLNTIDRIRLGLHREFLAPGGVDATHPGQYGKAGLDAWVPVHVSIYTITDVTTPRDIVFTLATPSDFGPADYGLRTWRGLPNPWNSAADSWQMLPGFTTPPTFTVHVVPAPGVGALVVAGGMMAMRRRR